MKEKEKENLKSKIFTALFWVFGERILAQLVSVAVSIILARLLSPEDYGVVAIVMVFITFANVFVTSGFGSALIQKKDADSIDFSSVFYINILISFGIYGILFFSAPYIAKFFNMDILSPALRILGIRIIVAAINSIQRAYVSRHMLFKRFFLSTLLGTLVSGMVGIILAYNGYGVWALVVQYLTNTCIDTTVLWFTVKWRPVLCCSWERVKTFVTFGWRLLISGLIDSGYSQIRSLLIGKIYSSSDLAYYNQGDKYPQLIVVNINSSISSVLFPAMANCQDDKKRVKNMTRAAVQVSSFVMWPLMLGLAVIASPLIRLLLTDKWMPCVPYLRIFCISYGFWPIHTSNLQAINAMGRSDLFLELEVVKKIMGMGILIISLHFSPLAIAFSLIVSGLISTFINAAPNRRLLGYSYCEQLKDLLPPFIISVIMALIVFPVQLLNQSDAVTIAMQIFAGIFIYIFLAVLTKQAGLNFILHFIKERNKR